MNWLFGILAPCEATEYVSKLEQSSSCQINGKEDMVLVGFRKRRGRRRQNNNKLMPLLLLLLLPSLLLLLLLLLLPLLLFYKFELKFCCE
jgi:hypothetical protein